MRHNTSAFAKILRCVRLINSQRGVEVFKDVLGDIVDNPGGAGIFWNALPLDIW